MSPLDDASDLKAAAYIDSGRNSDLPILVRAWFAQGEGAEQDEILALSVGTPEHIYVKRPSGELMRRSFQCECCAARTDCPADWHLVLAASETCNETTIDGVLCLECAESWSLAELAFRARSVAPARPDGDLEIVRELVAAIPANDATVSHRAAALAYLDDMIDRRVG
jgi:hypothetical protein